MLLGAIVERSEYAWQFQGISKGVELFAMSRPSSAGGGSGGLGAGKAGGGKHGGSGAAAAAVAAAAGVGSVPGSGSGAPCSVASLTPANLPGQASELTALFECPVCFDYVLPPILQCQAGHLVCNQCRQKLSCCPTCRGPLTPSIRNLAMEKVASNLPFPCKGEDIVFLATDINLPGAVDWVMMQSCFSHHFMLVLEKQEKYEGHQQFFAVVLLIGTRKQAENFAYRLELNGNRRRLTWEATPRSIHDGVAAAILNSDCLVFDTSIAHLFADNGNLGINVTISMC
ncbi:E3 ubiquitin-protein ligase Siah2 isoform X4 [Gadus macrocephalus]|uniref:E3 ubiquitin-protein ligase Siah2 isoform X4 n=1 Tax=Gadus macrocephalus TaxID=80720 RepID=UPI0028CB6ABB|nr:E3 ubiquitin-protein ligase Siah2 isoform X4 [Gadus macrocephalus]